MLILIIAGGPDKGRIYELTDAGPIVLGREGDQVKLNDRKVSREHARLWSEGGQWYLEDLGSRHGTYRNHKPLELGQHAKLKDGDYLQVGDTVMVLGRMAGDQSKSLAMLGAAGAPRPSKWRGPAYVFGGLSIAAMLGLGAYLAIELRELRETSVSPETFAQLQQQLIEAQEQQAQSIKQSIDRQGAIGKELLTHQQTLNNTLNQTQRVIGQHGDAVATATEKLGQATDPILESLKSVKATAQTQQLAIARIGDILSQQKDKGDSAKLLAAVTEMKGLLASQPQGDALVAKLQEAIQSNAKAAGEAVQLALAEHRKTADADRLATNEATQALFGRVIDSLAKLPTRDQIAEDVRLAVAKNKAQDDQFMRLVLAELRRTGEQITTDVVAAVGEDAGQAQTLMKQVVAELAKRPTGEQLAADLRNTLDQVVTKRDADLAELPSLMKQVMVELEDRPTSEQLAADLRRYIGEDAQRTELLIARVMTELDERPTAKEIALELQATDNESAARAASLLESVLEKVQTQEQLADQIASLQKQLKALPGRDDGAIRDVLSRLDKQDKNNAEMLAEIAELRKTIPDNLPTKLDEVLAQLDEQVRTQQITDAIEASIQRIADAKDQQTLAALKAFNDKLDALPDAAALAKVVQSQEALSKLLDVADGRDLVGELRSVLEQLAKRQPEANDEQLKQIIAMLKQREKTELLLAELHDAMNTQSGEVEAIKQQLLKTSSAADQAETDKTLRKLLAMVEDRLITDDSVRQAIRDEMRGTILPNQMAVADARDVNTTGPTNTQADTTQQSAVPKQRLTRLETAYKKAFDTDRPTTIGAGVVDPETGEVSEGHVLDPAVAKALGFETWRDWYLTDRHARDRRLQQEAIRQRNANETENDGTIELPTLEPRDDSGQDPQN